jgi:hypothetical protein
MSWTDLNTWKLVDQRQLINEVTSVDKIPAGYGEGSALSLRSKIKPVDLYSYLVGRFGEPNGKQSMLLRTPLEDTPSPNSGNIIHWDFEVQAGATRILITGLTREIHVLVSEKASDRDWLRLLNNLRADFAVHSNAKSKIQSGLEKWYVFANPFVALAEACAGLHENISDALEHEFRFDAMRAEGFNNDAYQEQLKSVGERANRIYADCLQLRTLTPVLGEAFINMLTALLAKPETKDDVEAWLGYRKSPFHTKLQNLSKDCIGFSSPPDKSTDAYKSFMRIRSKRNDILHANVVPELDKLETVYFDGKTPLYADAGDIFKAFWENYEAWVNPQGAISDYEDVHLFCIEVENLLEPRFKWEFREILDDKFPGYDPARRRFGKLFPDHVVHFMTGPKFIRYDDELSTKEH